MGHSIDLACPLRLFVLTTVMKIRWVEILPGEMRVFDQSPHQHFTSALPPPEKTSACLVPGLKRRGVARGFQGDRIGIRTDLRPVGQQNGLEIRMAPQHLP
jgi:hypothetical protein